MKRIIHYIFSILLFSIFFFGFYNSSFGDLVEEVILDFETTGGYTNSTGTWNRVTDDKNGGTYSLKSSKNKINCFSINEVDIGDMDIGIAFYFKMTSSASNYFYLRDNGTDIGWRGTGSINTWSRADIPLTEGNHRLEICYNKSNNGNNGFAYIDDIMKVTDSGSDTVSVVIENVENDFLYPSHSKEIQVIFESNKNPLNLSSTSISLNKWNGTDWGENIISGNIENTLLTTSNFSGLVGYLDYGKYKLSFYIEDSMGNFGYDERIFYVDEPLITLSNSNIHIGDLGPNDETFCSGFEIKIETVGADFYLVLKKFSDLILLGISEVDEDKTHGFGYDLTPFSGDITLLNDSTIIAREDININLNGERDTYTYFIKFGSKQEKELVAGLYEGEIGFDVFFDY